MALPEAIESIAEITIPIAACLILLVTRYPALLIDRQVRILALSRIRGLPGFSK
jgi:hypothetical protein